MKVRVAFKTPDIHVDEVVEGRTSDEVVNRIKQGVAKRVGLALRLVINAMSPVAFAQEVVRRYNDLMRKALPLPASSDEFLKLGEQEGIVTVLQP